MMKDLLEIGKLLFAIFWPTDSPEQSVQLRWRKSMFFAVLFTILILLFSFAWFQGKVPGLSGVALASDLASAKKEITVSTRQSLKQLDKRVTALESTQHQMLYEQLQNSLETQLVKRCTAIQRNNQDALDAANQRIYDITRQMVQIGEPYNSPLPSCDVILISPK